MAWLRHPRIRYVGISPQRDGTFEGGDELQSRWNTVNVNTRKGWPEHCVSYPKESVTYAPQRPKRKPTYKAFTSRGGQFGKQTAVCPLTVEFRSQGNTTHLQIASCLVHYLKGGSDWETSVDDLRKHQRGTFGR